MLDGYDALRKGGAWLDLSARGKIFATGRDRTRLLHNLTTNHIKQLAPGQGCLAFLLSPQGRIQADVHVFCLEERFLLDTDPGKLKSTVLKIAHHGSETSSTLPFLQAVNPEIVVVSSGRKSFSGTFLPDNSTLRRYCCHNPSIRIYRTDQNDEAEGLTAARRVGG
jgi:hypothetical protein